jgi:hypothetical protein
MPILSSGLIFDWRAGATTLAEIALSGKGAILIPFPYATDNHQQKNAESFVNAGAAEMILQNTLSGKILADRIQFYMNHPGELQQMAEKSLSFGRPDATERIVDLAMALAAKVVILKSWRTPRGFKMSLRLLPMAVSSFEIGIKGDNVIDQPPF